MYFTSGSDRAFEQLMQTRPGADHFDNGEAGAPEDCGTCRFYRPHWKYQFCVYEECPYQPGKVSSSTRRADLTRRSSSKGNGFPTSSLAAACCW